ncbi:MAG: glycosyltransferase family 2 protein [Bacteroidia bacterium]|jgi:glycosyltransferase involved in cell wall biosynthesis|nr:glycosyltransferase family 2 protein [Bacteroidia bacterium]MDG1747334.1 glycosyltransferase family 2 protein [Bacteroidia bacterium]
MKVSGFAIARNVVKADYPIGEALKSIAPLCDEIVVAVGNSDDQTRDYILGLGLKQLKIIDTIWDDELREGGRVLADETNKALAATNPQSDWCFYIQADECIHEDDIERISTSMNEYVNNESVDALLFDYRHFYGSYDYIGDSRKWYRKEIRIIRQGRGIKSWKDAQGFRSKNNEKLRVVSTWARIFHYGWVKHPKHQQIKQKQFHRLWHDDSKLEKMVTNKEEFDYSTIDSLQKFQETHPQLMRERINAQNWKFDFDPSRKNFTLKTWFLYYFEKITGIRMGEYKNYKLIK